MIRKMTTKQRQSKRVARIRSIIKGNMHRPRLAIFRSHRHLYGQLIDDEKRITLGAVKKEGTTIESGTQLGASIAGLCKEKKITQLVFDRGGYKYHGVIKRIADAVREGGVRI